MADLSLNFEVVTQDDLHRARVGHLEDEGDNEVERLGLHVLGH